MRVALGALSAYAEAMLPFLFGLIDRYTAIGTSGVWRLQRDEDRIVLRTPRDGMRVRSGRDVFDPAVRIGIDHAQNRTARLIAGSGVIAVRPRIVPNLVHAADFVDHLHHFLRFDVADYRRGSHSGRARLRAGAASHDHLRPGAVKGSRGHAIINRNQL